MANFIPARLHDLAPYSERKIFQHLANDSATSDWVVLHSLGLASAGNRPYGEVDFVVLVPGKGIVCLEVKGGNVRAEGGVWTTTNRTTGARVNLNRSPYMQARDGMFAVLTGLRNLLAEDDPARDCFISFAVVFPDVPAPPSGLEADPWETIDQGALRRESISALLNRNLNRTAEKTGRSLGGAAANTSAMERIRAALRPDFDLVVARSAQVHDAEEQLVGLSPAQYAVLDFLEVNERAVVHGPAGTGKTLLALEQASRDARSGRKVLLLCYNRPLGDWLQTEVRRRGDSDRVTVSTLHELLLTLVTESGWRAGFEEEKQEAGANRILQSLLPEYGEVALSDSGPVAESLIVDEAQDLGRPEYIRILNMLVEGGLSRGRWCFMGDFTRQAIFSSDGGVRNDQEFYEVLERNGCSPARFPLTENCRNTLQIASETAGLSGFDGLPYRTITREGPPVEISHWHDRRDQIRKLSRTVEDLITRDEFSARDVVILSPRRFENSAACGVSPPPPVRIADFETVNQADGNIILFSTVQRFKGLESPVVVLCDIESIEHDSERAILYTGMSRARSGLFLLLHEKTRSARARLFRERLERELAE